MRRTVLASATKFWPRERRGASPPDSSSSRICRGLWVNERSGLGRQVLAAVRPLTRTGHSPQSHRHGVLHGRTGVAGRNADQVATTQPVGDGVPGGLMELVGAHVRTGRVVGAVVAARLAGPKGGEVGCAQTGGRRRRRGVRWAAVVEGAPGSWAAVVVWWPRARVESVAGGVVASVDAWNEDSSVSTGSASGSGSVVSGAAGSRSRSIDSGPAAQIGVIGGRGGDDHLGRGGRRCGQFDLGQVGFGLFEFGRIGGAHGGT